MEFPLRQVRKNFTIEEEVANSITHGFGFLFGITALIIFVLKSNQYQNPTYTFSVLVYSFSLMTLYGNSMVYHGLPSGKAKNIFERMDHASVYLLIAGTYTPFCLIAVGGRLGMAICLVQWALAIIGVVFKSLWIDKYVKLHVLIFLAMGWTIILFGGTIYQQLTTTGLLLLIAGGVAYSIGVLFYIFDWFKYHHFVWHMFVITGSVLHFFAIYLYL